MIRPTRNTIVGPSFEKPWDSLSASAQNRLEQSGKEQPLSVLHRGTHVISMRDATWSTAEFIAIRVASV